MRHLRSVEAILWTVVLVTVCSNAIQAQAAASDVASRVHLVVPLHESFVGNARATMERVLSRTRRRLESRACQRALDEYRDGTGRSLTSVLEVSGRTAVEHLDTLYFVEANTSPQCVGGKRLAYTALNSRVVFICTQRFGPYATQQPQRAEMLIIHELLHTLGFGEAPLSSRDFTDRVADRCLDRSELLIAGVR